MNTDDGLTPGSYDGPNPGLPVYTVTVYLRNDDAGRVVLTVLGGPAHGWTYVPEHQHPRLARAVARHVTDYATRLDAEADLVDDVDTLDADAIITEHYRTTKGNDDA